MNYSQAMEFISGFSHFGKKISDLSRIAQLLENLNNPQDKLKFVHIAGTNGKGSVLELSSNAVINAGYKTGQFTSPFIRCYEDRIRINNHNIPKQKIADICEKVKSAVSDINYSQFEITFAIALLYWLEEKCDVIFLETGLGGLLDATNIIKNPIVTVITSISYDHEAILGNTIQKIARQKAGIIKQNVTNILSMGNYNECVKKVSEIAGYMHSELIIPQENDLSVIDMDIHGSKFIYKNQDYFIRMNGIHQIQNACTSIECINQLNNNGFSISYENIKKSFSEVQIAGRTEIINQNPLVILDGSHNYDGVNALFSITSKIKSPVIAVLGILKRKDYKMIVEAIEGDFKTQSNISEIICVDGFLDENINANELAEMFEYTPAYSMDYKSGYDFAVKKASNENKAVAIFGSLFLVTEIKKYLENNAL